MYQCNYKVHDKEKNIFSRAYMKGVTGRDEKIVPDKCTKYSGKNDRNNIAKQGNNGKRYQ
jgi:hypothetical protein